MLALAHGGATFLSVYSPFHRAQRSGQLTRQAVSTYYISDVVRRGALLRILCPVVTGKCAITWASTSHVCFCLCGSCAVKRVSRMSESNRREFVAYGAMLHKRIQHRRVQDEHE